MAPLPHPQLFMLVVAAIEAVSRPTQTYDGLLLQARALSWRWAVPRGSQQRLAEHRGARSSPSAASRLPCLPCIHGCPPAGAGRAGPGQQRRDQLRAGAGGAREPLVGPPGVRPAWQWGGPEDTGCGAGRGGGGVQRRLSCQQAGRCRVPQAEGPPAPALTQAPTYLPSPTRST